MAGDWTPWTAWLCVDSCGNTKEFRNRTCEEPANLPQDCDFFCDGDDNEVRDCYAGCCEGKKLPHSPAFHSDPIYLLHSCIL